MVRLGSGLAFVGLQLAVALAILLILAFVPPPQGRMLIMPIGNGSPERMIAVAVEHGARLVAPGPFNGSFVIDGARDRLGGPLAAMRVVMLAAPGAGCGQVVPA